MFSDDQQIELFEQKIKTSFPVCFAFLRVKCIITFFFVLQKDSQLHKCLLFGTKCKDVHLITVPARIGVNVKQPRDLETRYWIRYRVSNNPRVTRDLRATTSLLHNDGSDMLFSVVFVDQVRLKIPTSPILHNIERKQCPQKPAIIDSRSTFYLDRKCLTREAQQQTCY